MRRPLAATLLVAALAGTCAPTAAAGLQPYQMVRSLQLVQDRIADGDHAALPMQSRLLGIIDERLRDAEPELFEDPRNLHALLIYGTSGGNPDTLDLVVSRLALEGTQRNLGHGVVRYTRGDFAGARELLRDVKPLALPDELAAPLALVAGALLVQEDPTGALGLFDKARLLSPGTLIEEAALRRTLAITTMLHDAGRFALAAIQYVRRFLHSPYASQFAEAFVSGVVAMHEEVDLDLVQEATAMMSAEQAYVIYLRMARQSAIEGHERLLDFASRNARNYVGSSEEEADPRALLYSSVASVAAANVDEVLETLKGIDARRLSPNDRRLLQAARDIAGEIVAPPADIEMQADAEILAEPPPMDGKDKAPEADAASAALTAEIRDKLQAIDALLEETGQ